MNKLRNSFPKPSNKTLTENLAVTHKSTLNPVLDFFYHAPARQGQDNTDLFVNAFESDAVLALKALFYLRDVRQGKGQRKTFRDCLRYLYDHEMKAFNQVVPFVAEYGRWDDLLVFASSMTVKRLVYHQLEEDDNSEHPSLLAKWMPSENASSKETKKLAERWAKNLGFSPRVYRKLLSDLRSKIHIVESSMSANQWESIVYQHVPSRAMKNYRKAFGRHDEERFGEFINAAKEGKTEIKSKNLYPHEIVHEFLAGRGDAALEAQWKQLPNYFGDEDRKVLVVADVSGSMGQPVAPHTSVQAIEVSIGIAMYCAERNEGAFKDVVITFDDTPRFVEITGKSLRSKIQKVNELPWGGSTNIAGVFAELLRIAKNNRVPKKDMPSNIVIISDMEFNSCGRNTNLEVAKRAFKEAGYPMPTLTFWNVMSRHNQTPATKNEKGVFLVSGFSAETIGKVLNAEAVTPEDLMLEVLNSPRYAFVDELEL